MMGDGGRWPRYYSRVDVRVAIEELFLSMK
jgi:hypothetical protein